MEDKKEPVERFPPAGKSLPAGGDISGAQPPIIYNIQIIEGFVLSSVDILTGR